jgi:hypothetical protein
VEPFGLAGITLRGFGFSAGFALAHRQSVHRGGGQPLLKRADRGPQPDHVAVLSVSGQPVLVVIARDDRIGPPRRGLRSQRFLARVEPVAAHLAALFSVQLRIHRYATRGRRQVCAA